MIDSPVATMDRRKWLLRLIYVRLFAFSIFILIPWLTNGNFDSINAITDDMVRLLGAVFALSACWFALVRLNSHYVKQAYAQIIIDLFLITWTVNRTGGVYSYFYSLYFLEIVMSSILLERRGAFIAGTLSSAIHFAHLDLVKFGAITSTGPDSGPGWPDLQLIISINIFGYCAVAYLSNYLAESLRHAGAELEKSTGQITFLQAFSDRIIDSMGSGLITTDFGGRIYLFNRAAENITGRRMDEALHMTIRELFPEIQNNTMRFETWTRRTDGKEIYLKFSVSRVMIDDKDTAGFVWCIDDLTELRLLERQMRQKEQMAAIGAMSAGIAHEIRNPLASITGSFNLLQSELQFNPEQGRLAEIITRETDRLNRTITEFLSYARTPDPKSESVDLSILISETVSLMRNSPELKSSHSIETRLDHVTRPVDESMMRQVFYNLATNAFRAMPDGGRLTIRLEPRDGAARIQFEDTGEGMDEEELKKLFVPFQSSFINGTGLGLPIVYQIVNAHNGSISVTSRRGIGSVFAIDI